MNHSKKKGFKRRSRSRSSSRHSSRNGSDERPDAEAVEVVSQSSFRKKEAGPKVAKEQQLMPAPENKKPTKTQSKASDTQGQPPPSVREEQSKGAEEPLPDDTQVIEVEDDFHEPSD